MPLKRNESGVWHSELVGTEVDQISPTMAEAMPRYLTIFDEIFYKAKTNNEIEFLFSLFRVRGFQNEGWDPYQTTLDSIPSLVECLPTLESNVANHLQLWIYGHIVEASEPYEILANLLEVASGSHYAWNANFPPKKSGQPLSPGEKIRRIDELGIKAELPNASVPLKEIWNRDLRNAVFHSDYIVYGGGIRVRRPPQVYSEEEVLVLVNRSIAYHFALATIFKMCIEEYEEPITIANSPHFEGDPELRWRTIIRDGYGIAGVKDDWSPQELRSGKIPLQVGRFFQHEVRLLREDPTLDRLPYRGKDIVP